MEDYKLVGYCRFDDALLLPHSRLRDKLPDNPKTVIVCLFPYYVGELSERNVARYACVNDYHKVAGGILNKLTLQLKAMYPDDSFAAFTDASPIREVQAASRCGLGVIGCHGMLIHEIFGSRVFIGEIVTSLDLEPTETAQKSCLKCGLCIKACPTKALSGAILHGKNEPVLDKERCLSFISQQKRELTDWEKAQIKDGKMAWGCDICTDVCPLNKNTPVTFIKEFLSDITPVITRENIHEHIEAKPYNWRGKDVLLRNLDLLRNK